MIKTRITVPELLLALLLAVEVVYVGHLHAERGRAEVLLEEQREAQMYIASSHTPNTVQNNTTVGTRTVAGCIFSASHAYHVPPEAMMGIMSVEGGHVGQEVGPNINGTYDLGPMQINSLWAPQLARLWHVDSGTARSWIRDDGCENVYVAAWILKQKIAETGTLYDGIAYYHSATRKHGNPYANKVVSRMEKKGLFPYKQEK